MSQLRVNNVHTFRYDNSNDTRIKLCYSSDMWNIFHNVVFWYHDFILLFFFFFGRYLARSYIWNIYYIQVHWRKMQLYRISAHRAVGGVLTCLPCCFVGIGMCSYFVGDSYLLPWRNVNIPSCINVKSVHFSGNGLDY